MAKILLLILPLYLRRLRLFEKAKGLAMFDTDSFKANLSQGGQHFVVLPPPTTSCVEKDWDKLAKEELGRIIDEYKDKAIKAEDYSATLEQALAARDNRVLELDNRVLELENTVTALNDDLEAARKAKAGFMAHGDMKTLEAEATRKASALLLDGLKPLIASEKPYLTLLHHLLHHLLQRLILLADLWVPCMMMSLP